jgi:hypothetical protein
MWVDEDIFAQEAMMGKEEEESRHSTIKFTPFILFQTPRNGILLNPERSKP